MRAPRLRSVLYVPGANGRALDKARELSSDALILDLEDSVAAEAKPSARDRVCQAVSSRPYAPRTVAIRINGIDTPWYGDDLAAAVAAEPDAIVVPKVDSGDDILAVERALEALGDHTTSLWVMLETPSAVLRAAEIAAAGTRLRVLVLGTNDLLVELRAQHQLDRRPLELSLMLCLLAARAAGRAILDGVYNDIHDSVGLEAECVTGRALGFDGKTLIHPSQIDVCNRIFSPSEAELAQARRVIAAFEQASQSGAAVATLDGRLIEQLHVRAAESLLAQAD